MKKNATPPSDDDIEKVLIHYHQQIKQRQSNLIDDAQMREKIIRMAANQPIAVNDNKDLNLLNASPSIHKDEQYPKTDLNNNNIKLPIPYRWAKVASWVLVASGVLLASIVASETGVLDLLKPPMLATDNDAPPSKLRTANHLDKADVLPDASSVPMVDEMSLEDLLGGEIVMAQIEPSSNAPQEGDTESQNLANRDKDSDVAFQYADHKPSINISIEQAPVLPAGSMSDPKQIEIDDSI